MQTPDSGYSGGGGAWDVAMLSTHLLTRFQRRLAVFAALIALAAALAAASCSSDDPQQQQAQQQDQQQQSAPQQSAAQADDVAAQQAAAQPDQQQQQQAAPAPDQQDQAEPAEPDDQTEQQPAPGTDDSGVVYDPGRETLNEGERFGSNVASIDDARQFRFEAEEGDWLRIRVDGKDGMDPILTLLQPDRTEIAVNDDVSGANRDSLLVVQVPTTGLQVIRVAPYDAASIGDFVIRVERLEIPPDNDSGGIAIGGQADGRLGEPGDVDVFEFPASAGQSLTLTVSGDTGVDVFAQLIAPSGNLVAVDDDGGHGLDAEMFVAIEEDGTHRLEVWSALNGAGQRQLIGAYRVFVRQGPPVVALDPDTRADVAAVGLTFLQAMRDGDTATIRSLAGPEATTVWGWESNDDVARDLVKMQSIGLGISQLQTVAVGDALNAERARLYVQLAEDDWLRIELIRSAGLWTVDDWAHSLRPPGDAPATDDETDQSESADAADQEAAQSDQPEASGTDATDGS